MWSQSNQPAPCRDTQGTSVKRKPADVCARGRRVWEKAGNSDGEIRKGSGKGTRGAGWGEETNQLPRDGVKGPDGEGDR